MDFSLTIGSYSTAVPKFIMFGSGFCGKNQRGIIVLSFLPKRTVFQVFAIDVKVSC
jgi:hypothetical protein